MNKSSSRDISNFSLGTVPSKYQSQNFKIMSHDVTREQSESRKECLSQKLTHTLNMSRTVNILSRLGRTINHPLARDWSGLGRSSLRIKTK